MISAEVEGAERHFDQAPLAEPILAKLPENCKFPPIGFILKPMSPTREKKPNRRVLCVGSASVDIKAFSFQEDVKNAYREGTIDLVAGGVARGMAINLRQLGFEVSIASVIGQDIFGEFLRKDLSGAGVNVELLRVSKTSSTALFSVMAAKGGESSCVYANGVLQEIAVDREFTDFVDRASIDTVVIDSNVSHAVMERLYALKATRPVFVFQNATSPDIAKKSLPWASQIDLFAANEHEAAAILGHVAEPDDATADGFRALGFSNFIVTFGERGVLVSLGGKNWIEPAYKPSVVVDTIGAGDAFAAGFLYGYLGDKSEKTCIRYGLASARETIATRDTVCSILTADYLEGIRLGDQAPGSET